MNTRSTKYIPFDYFLSEDSTEEIIVKIDNTLLHFSSPIKKVLWLYNSLKTIKSKKRGCNHYYAFERKTENYLIELIENTMNLSIRNLSPLSTTELILYSSFFSKETQLQNKIKSIISIKLKERHEDEFSIQNEISSIILPFYNEAPKFSIDLITDRVNLIGETYIDNFHPWYSDVKNIFELKTDEISNSEKENINKKLVIDINVFKKILSNFFNYVLKGSTIEDIEIDAFVDAIVNGKKGKTEKIKSIFSILESAKERSFFLMLIFYLSGIETIIEAPTAFCTNFVLAWQIEGLGIDNLKKHTGKKNKILPDFINTRNYDNLEMILSKQTNFNEFDEIFKTFIIKMREAKNAYSTGFKLKKK